MPFYMYFLNYGNTCSAYPASHPLKIAPGNKGRFKKEEGKKERQEKEGREKGRGSKRVLTPTRKCCVYPFTGNSLISRTIIPKNSFTGET